MPAGDRLTDKYRIGLPTDEDDEGRMRSGGDDSADNDEEDVPAYSKSLSCSDKLANGEDMTALHEYTGQNAFRIFSSMTERLEREDRY